MFLAPHYAGRITMLTCDHGSHRRVVYQQHNLRWHEDLSGQDPFEPVMVHPHRHTIV